jgi:preprotein translocase subunit SecF
MRWPLTRLLPHHTNINFVRFAPYAAALSAVLILGSCVSFFFAGFNLGTDFQGGAEIQLTTPGPAPVEFFRTEVVRLGMTDVKVQGTRDGKGAIIKFLPPAKGDATAVLRSVEQDLSAKVPGLHIKSDALVAASISGEQFLSGFIALGMAMLLMLAYIWFRFQLQFGLGAVIAIFHDVVLTLGLLSVLHVEFNTSSIAALLTVIGYSMNEKVITFDRLRENLRKFRRAPLAEVINLSENERLSRTLITGTTALLALGGMLFLGGPALYPLTVAMVFGIVIGTYSSIYVALPVILLWGVNRADEEAKPIKFGPASGGPASPRP